ncbi:TetR/AcrR family transcriptional regulator [Agromyces larvae]|uniref:TetR/AcrR family transcriptional regulator n=1 Tax=Agromyces larvae TaxID=2929802 RepID=A0ABY4C061_9MICO|nr:TetR/AcrR family transcriptional regulator [Agromyces larvae]UOE44827.1 TetR/AcrR family transcriptional regulator [Agromyces larvae]
MTRQITERADLVLALADTFRRHGFEGASLATMSAETGLGKGSLYHFFPGGKEEMAAVVLDEVHGWFSREVHGPLTSGGDPGQQIAAMFVATARYFGSRQLVCLFGAFALGRERERFAQSIRRFFDEWIVALRGALERLGRSPDRAETIAIDVVSGIQGALVVARALQDEQVFLDALERLQATALSDA